VIRTTVARVDLDALRSNIRSISEFLAGHWRLFGE
jgi:hypothetical protein